MSFLRGANTIQASAYTGLQLQTSCSSLPIAIMWGATRLAPNVIATGNFHSFPQSANGKSSGKGGLAGGGGSGNYDYTAGFYSWHLRGDRYTASAGVWDNQSTPRFTAPQSFNGAANTGLGAIGFGIMPGFTPQAPWGFTFAGAIVSAVWRVLPMP